MAWLWIDTDRHNGPVRHKILEVKEEWERLLRVGSWRRVQGGIKYLNHRAGRAIGSADLGVASACDGIIGGLASDLEEVLGDRK